MWPDSDAIVLHRKKDLAAVLAAKLFTQNSPPDLKPVPANADIFIVGAGPAGATLSLFLAKKKIPHVIVDAAKFPRDKICGDGLDLKVVRVLRQLDPQIVEKELPAHPRFQKSWGLRAWTPNGRSSEFLNDELPSVPNRPVLWTAKRLDFDDFLVKKFDPRYADFHEETKVASLEKTPEGWKITSKKGEKTFETRARLVVGADGDHSVVLRALGERQIDRRHYAGTLRCYHANLAAAHPRNPIEIYMPPRLPMSYFYMFPLAGNHWNVGFGMVSEVISRHKINLREVFQDLIKNDPVLRPRFEGATALENPIGYGIPLASRQRRTAGDHWLLLGDAASMVCPSNGEGIGTGMFSGLIAAAFIERAVETNDFSMKTFRHFDREVYKRMRGEIFAYKAMMNINPYKLWDLAIKHGTHAAPIQWYFNWAHRDWLRTGYERPINVEVD